MSHSPFHVVGESRPTRWLLTCDHATNRVPDWVGGGTLGICAADMERHIAFDVGAAGLTLALAERLGATAILSDFSRLVIDANRAEDDPTLVMKLYDGTIIPANRHIGADEVNRRLDRLYRPYHDALGRLTRRQDDIVIVAIHSFTPSLKAGPKERAPRPWHIGILHSHLDGRLSRPLIYRLRGQRDLCVGDNEPYSGHLPGDSIDRHALRRGQLNTLIEVRNDLIATEADQRAWADRLAPLLLGALGDVTD